MTPRVITVLVALCALPAFAQATRTWVSGVGDDANPCSRTAPCKTFAGAISKTAAGGEINAIDAAGFGAVAINKSITINVTGVTGGVLVNATNAINVIAGATDTVVIRGLDLEGLGTSLCGVRFVSGKALHIEDTTINGFNNGICVDLAMPTGNERLFVKNVGITKTVATGTFPVGAITLTGGEAVLERVRVQNAPTGIVVSGAAKLTLANSTLSGVTGIAVAATGTASISIERTTFASNGTAVSAAAGTTVRVSDSIFSFNDTGITGAVSSYGNNRLNAGNTTNGTPSATLLQQ